MHSRLGVPKRVVSENGVELQVGALTGHKIRVLPCASADGDAALEGDFSHVKLCVLQLQLGEKHQAPGTSDFTLRDSKLAGPKLANVKMLKLQVGGQTHVLAPTDGKLELVLAKDALPLPAAAKISMEYESAVFSTSSKECDWFAGDYEAKLALGQKSGFCVIS
jgi:hypothetical protein